MVRRFDATGAGASATGAAGTGVSTVMLGAGAATGASLGSVATGGGV